MNRTVKHLLIGMGLFVGSLLLLFLSVWFNAWKAVHDARIQFAAPAVPTVLAPLVPMDKLIQPYAASGAYWLDNQHFLIKGVWPNEKARPDQDLYVGDVKTGKFKLFFKSSTAEVLYLNNRSLKISRDDLYNNENGTVPRQMLVFDMNFNVAQKGRVIQWDEEKNIEMAEIKGKPLLATPNGLFYETRIDINNIISFSYTWVDKNGNQVPLNLKMTGGIVYDKKNNVTLVNTEIYGKNQESYLEINNTGSVESEKFNPLLSFYKIKVFTILPTNHGMVYYTRNHGGETDINTGVFLEKKDKNIVRIWGGPENFKILKGVEFSNDECHAVVSYGKNPPQVMENGFDVITLC